MSTKLTVYKPRPVALKNATNLKTVKTTKKKKGKKVVPTQSFKTAFHKLQPSKEIRKDFTILDMSASLKPLLGLQLDNIIQGTQVNERLGSNIHMSYVHFNGTAQSNSTVKTKVLRVMLIRERNNRQFGEPPVFNNLYKSLGTTAVTPNGSQTDQRWPINEEVAQLIWQKKYKLLPEGEGMTFFKEKIRVNKLVKYKPNSPSTNEPYHGRLYFIANLSDCDNLATDTTVIFSASVRIFFKDYYKAR